jgi:hypothetical protein
VRALPQQAFGMGTTPKDDGAARAQLQAWYLRALLPKVARAATAGAVDVRAASAFDDEMRALLDLSRTHERAA